MKNKVTRRPRKIKIKDAEYKVKAKKNFYGFKKHKKALKKEKLHGRIDFNKELVEVEEVQPTDEMIDTVIHEVMHGIVREWPIEVDGRKEERFVTELANGLTSVFIDNPKLVGWMHERILAILAARNV